MYGKLAMYRGKTVYHVASLREFPEEMFEVGAVLHNIETESYYIKSKTGYVPLTVDSICSMNGYAELASDSKPSSKCAYCGCTNDHIYGTCDYCGAPLEG